MPPLQCPEWEYKNHAHASSVGLRCEAILDRLKNGAVQIDASLRDTRPIHKEMFVGLTPPDCDYYAGHYRGDKYPFLEHHTIRVQGPHADPRVGVKPSRVRHEMGNLTKTIIPNAIRTLDILFAKPEAEASKGFKLQSLVAVCCRILVEFLRIHPYVNGNGHIGRLKVWFLLWRFGYWPQSWPLDGHPPYDALLTKYRDGERAGLEIFLLRAING